MSDELKEVHVRLKIQEGQALYSEKPLLNAQDAIDLMAGVLKEMDREMLMVVNLNNKGKPINYHVVSVGDLNSSIIDISNVFKSAILSNSKTILMLHNHPSGDPTPSRPDIVVTNRCILSGSLLGITILDHVIVGGETGYIYSIRREGDCRFLSEGEMMDTLSHIAEATEEKFLDDEWDIG